MPANEDHFQIHDSSETDGFLTAGLEGRRPSSRDLRSISGRHPESRGL
jgi:hypothetical protein